MGAPLASTFLQLELANCQNNEKKVPRRHDFETEEMTNYFRTTILLTVFKKWGTMQSNFPFGCTQNKYDVNRVFRYGMQSAPPGESETSTAIPPAGTVLPERSPAIPASAIPDSQASIATKPAVTVDPQLNFIKAIYVPEIADDDLSPVEDITPQNQQVIMPINAVPTLDSLTCEISQLHSLLTFMPSCPAISWNFYELLPHITEHLIHLSLGSNSLRHSLLALTATVQAVFSGIMSEKYFMRKLTSLRSLQDAISSDAVDEATALAVIIHVGVEVLLGQLRNSRKHLRGVFLILELFKEKGRISGKGLSPLGLLIQRMMVQLDRALSSINGDPTQFEYLDPTVEIEDRKWLSSNIGASKGVSCTNVEWILASFEMDNLQHRGYSTAKRVHSWREIKDPQRDEKIRVEYCKLMQGMELWKQRAVVREQEEIEQHAGKVNKPSDDSQLRFLQHEPLYIKHTYYAKLLNQWRWQSIYNSLIVDPGPGPGPSSHDRYALAVDICRTHAALGENAFVGPSWQGLFYAGMVFGGKKQSPKESEWIMERLKVVVEGLPSWKRVIESMPLLWEGEMSHWNGFAGLSGLLDP